jgi:hypothetical protein
VDDDLRQLVDLTIKDQIGNPLWPDGFEPFCAAHGMSKSQFCDAFAKLVAVEFANGEMSYSDADLAMNQLFGILDVENPSFAWDVYLAFDSGEYYREEDPETTIPWQKYTLPAVMELLAANNAASRA